MANVVANGINIHYETRGEGERKLILLHGLMLSGRIWDKAMKLIPPEFQCFAIDLRGFGDSEKPKENYSLLTFGKDISCLLKALNIDKASVVGHSISGSIAIYFAANYPQQVDKVVLADTFARRSAMLGGGGEGMQELAKAFTPPVQFNKETIEKLFEVMFYKESKITPEDTEMLTQEALKADQNAIMQTAMSPMSVDVEAELKKIEKPLLVIQGAQDSFFPIDEAKFMAGAVPQGKLAMIDKSGHCPMIEQPEDFTTVLVDFLKSS